MRSKNCSHRFIRYTEQGREAKPGSSCPYGITDIGLRCAWLAGHYDAHGYIAWAHAAEFQPKRGVISEKKGNQS